MAATCWAGGADAALAEGGRVAAVHALEGRWERYAALRTLAAAHRLAVAAGGL